MKVKKGFYHWLSLKKLSANEFPKSLRGFLGFLAIGFTIIFCMAVVWAIIILFQTMTIKSQPDLSAKTESIRNIGLVVAALLGLPFLVWRSLVAQVQADTASDALFNDKLNAAAQDLTSRRPVNRDKDDGTRYSDWEDDLLARAIAIDRLEGLSIENPWQSRRISQTLAAYIRFNFPVSSLTPTEEVKNLAIPRMDLQKAVDALGRIYVTAAETDKSEWRLDLQNCNFDGVSFSGGFFRAADFRKSRFEGADLGDADFSGAWLHDCLFNYATFLRTNLTGAKMIRSVINRPTILPGGFNAAFAHGTTKGLVLSAAEIPSVTYLGKPDRVSETFGTADTQLYHETYPRRPEGETQKQLFAFIHSDRSAGSENMLEALEEFKKSGFESWSPFPSTDGSTGHLIRQLYEKLDLSKWPYI